MRKRDKERLDRETAKMRTQSKRRVNLVRKMHHESLKAFHLPDGDLSLPELPKPKKKRELQWRKHKHTNISWLKNKRVKIVENTKKKEYTISGLNKSELNKVTEALR